MDFVSNIKRYLSDEFITSLLEAMDKERGLRGIKDYLKDLIEMVEPNTRKENAER